MLDARRAWQSSGEAGLLAGDVWGIWLSVWVWLQSVLHCTIGRPLFTITFSQWAHSSLNHDLRAPEEKQKVMQHMLKKVGISISFPLVSCVSEDPRVALARRRPVKALFYRPPGHAPIHTQLHACILLASTHTAPTRARLLHALSSRSARSTQ